MLTFVVTELHVGFIYRKCFHISLQISLAVFVSCEEKGKKTTTFFMELCSIVYVCGIILTM